MSGWTCGRCDNGDHNACLGDLVYISCICTHDEDTVLPEDQWNCQFILCGEGPNRCLTVERKGEPMRRVPSNPGGPPSLSDEGICGPCKLERRRRDRGEEPCT